MKEQAVRESAMAVAGRRSGKVAGRGRFPIVCIGASAGGLEAISELLGHLPDRPGMAFVVVQHLDPAHASPLPALLQRMTSLTVMEARNGMPVEVNCVYVIPPNRTIRLSGRRLRVSARPGESWLNMPIDRLLESLADEEAGRGIAVILSGNGSDGSRGALAVKAAGGLTLAQDTASAKCVAMPASAVAAGCIDFVLSPGAIARKLMRLAVQFAEGAPGRALGVRRDRQVFDQIVALLRQRCGVDFAHYKCATIDRRIHRRMALRGIDSLQKYAEYVRTHAEEAQELFNDMLIHVTGFFRDAPVFAVLKRTVFPRLLKGRGAESPLRIWVPGCSSGEEVYSLAMALMEYMAERRQVCPVHFFGTDINLAALDRARAGCYPASIAADVSPDRLRRYFTKEEGGYRISKSIRKLCVFARQNVVADPPFSNLDMVSCRNVLIYLGPELQRKVFPVFHYALQPKGYLLLGKAETIGTHGDLFSIVDKRGRLYAKKVAPVRPGLTLGLVPPAPGGAAFQGRDADSRGQRVVPEIERQADRVVLAHYGPPGVVVNQNLEVFQFRGETGPYLAHRQGEASLNLLKMAREGLAAELRAVIGQALKQDGRARREGVRLKQDGGIVTVDIEVMPLAVAGLTDRFLLIVFEEGGDVDSAPVPGKTMPRRASAAAGAGERLELARLRAELSALRESLHVTIEEQEATNEELRSANEEIMSSNEELQSSNEELETAKEELQTTNEELSALNDDLERRNTEMRRVNNDLHNLLGSVHIPVVMVGADLRIRRFTMIAEKVLSLGASDVGRPIAEIKLKVAVPELGKHINDVVDTLQVRRIEVQDPQGHWWSVHIRPYRTIDHKIDGAVIVFMDIDLLKVGLDRGAMDREYVAAMVNTVREPVVVLDQSLIVVAANDAFYGMFKLRSGKTLNRLIYDLGKGDWEDPRLRSLLEDVLPHRGNFHGFVVDHTFRTIGPRRLLVNACRLVHGDGKTAIIVLAIADATARAEP